MSLRPYVHLEPGSLRGVPEGGVVDLPDEARSHLERVLRLQAGAPLVVADGRGREAAAILGVGQVVIDGVVIEHPPARPELRLVQALGKGRKADDVVRSATELGVDSVVLVASQRSVTKPAAGREARLTARWRSIAVAAAEQSRRPHLPEVWGPVALADEVSAWPDDAVGVIAHPAADFGLRRQLESLDLAEAGVVTAAIGPEGGWTDQEVRLLESAGLLAARLGPSVLRTEHAGHALCAILAFELGRMA